MKIEAGKVGGHNSASGGVSNSGMPTREHELNMQEKGKIQWVHAGV
jgi:hypothetical protein